VYFLVAPPPQCPCRECEMAARVELNFTIQRFPWFAVPHRPRHASAAPCPWQWNIGFEHSHESGSWSGRTWR